jgi:hypothetical protein
MANSDVISAVSEMLEKRLTAGLSALRPPPIARLHDLVTPVTSDPPTVTLFLYQIVEDPSVRNRVRTTRVANEDAIVQLEGAAGAEVFTVDSLVGSPSEGSAYWSPDRRPAQNPPSTLP